MNQQDMILPFCKSVKFLYSGVKKLYSERCHEEVFWGFSFKNLGKVIYETENP